MIIPIWYLLIVYGLFLLIAGIFFLFNFFHIVKFGLNGIKTGLVLILYAGSFTTVVIINIEIISQFDWTQTITLGELFITIPGL